MSQRKLSQHFSLAELTKSSATARHGLDNTPPPKALAALELLCLEVLEPLRSLLGRPIVINSGYRSPEVNRHIGGSSRSQHCLGEAADIECPGVSNLALALHIESGAVPFDQLILEFHDVGDDASGWVHVSHRGAANRRQVLTAVRVDGVTQYRPGLPRIELPARK
jgi:hypothetical protein